VQAGNIKVLFVAGFGPIGSGRIAQYARLFGTVAETRRPGPAHMAPVPNNGGLRFPFPNIRLKLRRFRTKNRPIAVNRPCN
jgi:hypothetical protein